MDVLRAFAFKTGFFIQCFHAWPINKLKWVTNPSTPISWPKCVPASAFHSLWSAETDSLHRPGYWHKSEYWHRPKHWHTLLVSNSDNSRAHNISHPSTMYQCTLVEKTSRKKTQNHKRVYLPYIPSDRATTLHPTTRKQAQTLDSKM